MVIPLLPTTCFLLLGAGCWARSWPAADRWLHENRVFGPHLTCYRETGAISPGVRRGSLTLLWGGLVAGGLAANASSAILVLLGAVGLIVTLHVVRLPVLRRIEIRSG
jgi:uncharacterized membrane protein YbaN (DUF454 family)